MMFNLGEVNMKFEIRSIPYFVAALLVLVIMSCSERADQPTSYIYEIHPAEWMKSSSTDFHAKKVAVVGITSCAACHGSDYRGGRSDVSCYTCHSSGPSGHPEGWMSSSSENYHGSVVAQEGWEQCTGCHGADLTGGISGISCSACHDGPSGHSEDWMNESSNNFHGPKVVQVGWEPCKACHGADLTGGISGISCFACHDGPSGHPEGWMNESSDNFHGQKVVQAGWETCKACHGTDFMGGISGISCFTCHDGPSGHPEDWLNPGTENFHGAAIKRSGWDMKDCRACHGHDYAGGIAGYSCLTCHTDTPEACNTCHGNSLNSAPPEDTEGNTETDFKSIGAHQAHLSEGSISNAVACSECHTVPQILYDAGHIDSELPAEVRFGDLASDDGSTIPEWNGEESCSNVYCHGGFPLGNRDNIPEWTDVGEGEAACGTCHGLPPKQPHPSVTLCSLCHASVVDQNNNIIDKDRHINGRTDL